jgi:hypothetical protein
MCVVEVPVVLRDSRLPYSYVQHNYADDPRRGTLRIYPT